MEATSQGHPLSSFPRWLTGDWGRWIRDPVDLMRLALLIGALVTLVVGPRNQSFRMLLTFGVSLLPRAADAPRPFDFAFVAAMWLQAWGNVFGAFNGILAYDKLVHTVLSGASAALLYLVLVRLRVVPDLASESAGRHRLGMVLLTSALGLSLMGGMYEIYEWFADSYLGAHLYVGYGDSIGDLTVDLFGSVLAALLILAWDSRGWGTHRRPRPAGDGEEDPVAEAGEDLAEKLPEPVPPHEVERAPGASGMRPRWRGPVRGPLELLRLSFLVGLGIALAAGNLDVATRFAVTFAVLLAVRRLYAPVPLELFFIAAMAVQAWGAFGDELQALGTYDAITHLVVAAASAPILYVALIRLELIPGLARRRVHERAAIGLIGFAFGFSAGILHELYIYLANELLGASYEVGYGTLIAQLGLDAAGALIGAAVLVIWDVQGWEVTRQQAPRGEGRMAQISGVASSARMESGEAQ